MSSHVSSLFSDYLHQYFQIDKKERIFSLCQVNVAMMKRINAWYLRNSRLFIKSHTNNIISYFIT